LVGLTNGVSYSFEVTATNIVGESSASLSASVIPASLPSVPMNVSTSVYDKCIIVTSSEPSNTGGINVAIINYNFVLSQHGEMMISNTSAIVSSSIMNNNENITYTFCGLTNGIEYDVVISAENFRGYGVYSEIVSATPVAIPSSPLNVVVIRSGDHSVNISFTSPITNGGTPILYYTATSIPASLSTSQCIPSIIDYNNVNIIETCVIQLDNTGLVNGGNYTFIVTATNDVGTSPVSTPSHWIQPGNFFLFCFCFVLFCFVLFCFVLFCFVFVLFCFCFVYIICMI